MTRQKTEEEWSTEHVQDSEMGKGTTEHRGQRGQAGCACSHRPLPCYGVEGQFPTAPLGLNPGVAPSQNLVNTWAEKGGVPHTTLSYKASQNGPLPHCHQACEGLPDAPHGLVPGTGSSWPGGVCNSGQGIACGTLSPSALWS